MKSFDAICLGHARVQLSSSAAVSLPSIPSDTTHVSIKAKTDSPGFRVRLDGVDPNDIGWLIVAGQSEFFNCDASLVRVAGSDGDAVDVIFWCDRGYAHDKFRVV